MAAVPWRAVGGNCRTLMSAVKKPAKKAAAGAGGEEKPLRGILKPQRVSPVLSHFLGGAPQASRTDAVKKVWDHIKLNNLQNPENKKEIICDDKLKTIFSGKETVNFLEIARLLGQHFVKKSA